MIRILWILIEEFSWIIKWYWWIVNKEQIRVISDESNEWRIVTMIYWNEIKRLWLSITKKSNSQNQDCCMGLQDEIWWRIPALSIKISQEISPMNFVRNWDDWTSTSNTQNPRILYKNSKVIFEFPKARVSISQIKIKKRSPKI